MSFLRVLLTICLTANLISAGCIEDGRIAKKNIPTEKEIVQNLITKMPSSRIKKSVVKRKVYFTQEMSANDAVITIYDKSGNEVGSCDYWNKQVHPLCSKVTKTGKVVFVPADNVWNLQAVNTYRIDLTTRENPSVKIDSTVTRFDSREAKVVQGLVNSMSNSRVLKFDLSGVIYFTQEMSANDAVINIYDRNGIEIGSCDYWNKQVHPLCPVLKNSEAVYIPADNVWNLKPANKFNVVQKTTQK